MMPEIKGRTRPHKWKSGPNPDDHKKYIPFLKAKSQAAFRLEDWELTWDDWLILWPEELWLKRGRASDALALTRKNATGPWSLDNCHVVTRLQQLSEANRRRTKTEREKYVTRSKTKKAT